MIPSCSDRADGKGKKMNKEKFLKAAIEADNQAISNRRIWLSNSTDDEIRNAHKSAIAMYEALKAEAEKELAELTGKVGA